MHKKISKAKRHAKRKANQFVERMFFLFKISLLLVVLFFMILFLVIRPVFTSDYSNNRKDTVVSYAEGNIEETFIAEMIPHAKTAQNIYGVRPSVLIAQAALESSWGESTLSIEANNFFGIKGASAGRAYQTNEYSNDEWIEIDASFKQYPSVKESVLDYAALLANGTTWDPSLYHGAITAPDYQTAATAIQTAGYATDPDYAQKVIQIIEQYQLYTLDDE